MVPDLYLNRSLEECRGHVGLPLDIPILGFASSDSFLDMEMALSSLAIVAETFPDVKLIMTGAVKPSVIKQVRDLGLEKNVRASRVSSRRGTPMVAGMRKCFFTSIPRNGL